MEGPAAACAYVGARCDAAKFVWLPIGDLGSGASCGSSGKKTCRSVVLDVRTGKDCFKPRAGVPLPSGDGTRGADKLRRWAGREARVEEDGESGLDCRRLEAVLAIPACQCFLVEIAGGVTYLEQHRPIGVEPPRASHHQVSTRQPSLPRVLMTLPPA